MWINTVWVKRITPPPRLLLIFAKRLGIFNWNFAHLLCVQIYDRLPNFIQLSPNFTKLCCIKRDYPPPRILSLSLLQNINCLITYLFTCILTLLTYLYSTDFKCITSLFRHCHILPVWQNIAIKDGTNTVKKIASALTRPVSRCSVSMAVDDHPKPARRRTLRESTSSSVRRKANLGLTAALVRLLVNWIPASQLSVTLPKMNFGWNLSVVFRRRSSTSQWDRNDCPSVPERYCVVSPPAASSKFSSRTRQTSTWILQQAVRTT